jgi:7-cyano-7-deazaguanine synthase in queuosine biosynthesis
VTYELLLEGGRAHVRGAHRLVWSVTQRESNTVRASIDPWLRQLGAPANAAIDLVRLAAAAYMVDRLTKRRSGFSRTIDLHVHVTDPTRWDGPLDDTADLLFWLTGDTWNLEVSGEEVARPAKGIVDATSGDVVVLLSGGLDSFCGAALSNRDQPRVFLGHWDNSTVKHAQDESWRWLTEHGGIASPYRQIQLTQVEEKRERSTRSRALLFMALAAAVAQAAGARVVEVPENGFTSLNPPLGADRGGALSTRSTHPRTLRSVNRLYADLGVDVQFHDPYAQMTKGELLAEAAAGSPVSFAGGAADTLSCGKLDGRFYRGGNPNHHCGLCVPCLVRRGAFLAAGVRDGTAYLSEYLTGADLDKLLAHRAADIAAVRHGIDRAVDDVALMTSGSYPDDFDFDAAVDLCKRGFKELQAVPLP